MADKSVIIGGKKMMYGTSVKASPETSSSTTPTFDGAITMGQAKVSWSLELSKVRYEDLATHRELSELLDTMLDTPKMITIRETVKTSTENYTIVDNYYNCVIEGNDFEIKPDDHTVENLKFKSSHRKRRYEEN